MALPVGTWALGLVDNSGASSFEFEDSMSFPPPRPPMHLPGMPPLPPMMPPPYPLPPMGGMIPVGMGMMPTPLEMMFGDKMMAPVPMTVPAPIPIPTPPKTPPKKMPQQQMMGKKSEYHSNERHSMRSYNTSMSRSYQNYQGNNSSNSSKGPPVTVFVGNITDRASDSLIRLLLQRCGTVVNWKRVQGANGKLQAFGFCEYADPESALRAIRLLHDWEIGDRKLVVKVDAKTKEKLDEYKASKKPKPDSKPGEGGEQEDGEDRKGEKDADDEELDEQTKRDDTVTRESIVLILRDHSMELSRPFEYKEKPKKMNKSQETAKANQEQADNDPKNNLDELELEEEKKTLIHREIDKFRDTYKRAEEEKERDRERKDKDRKDREPRDNREARNSRDRENRRVHESSQERTRFRNRNREKSRDREQSPWERKNREYRNRSRERGSDRSRSRSRDREWSRERDQSRERSKENFATSRSKEKDWEKEKEEEEEAYEKKRLERKVREKEAAYQERLRNWEARERRRAKEYEKERQKEEEKRREEVKEARRLKEFLEDYDDERDDPKYYKGSALARRLKEREKEIEADARDRQREKEELEELRRKLAEDGHPDPDAEAKRIQQEEEERLMKPKIKHEPPDSENEQEHELEVEHRTKMKPIGRKEQSLSPVAEERPIKKIVEDENTQNSLSGFSDIVTPVEETKPLGFPGLKLGVNSPGQQTVRSPTSTPTSNLSISVPVVSKKKKITVDEVFTTHDEDSSDQPKKRKLIPLDDTSDDSKSGSQMTTEEKRKHIKNLIDKIPTAKEQLFAYSLDWSLVDNSLMEMRIRPWINKKIVEYIGEEEPTLVDFICSKVLAGSAANSILEDVSMVLDEEAEVFVVKMWRLLIYEIEAKKLGLVK